MDSPRWQRVQGLFHEAAGLPVERRAAYLAEACRDDDSVASDVLALLEADARDTSFVDRGVGEAASEILGEPATSALEEFGPYRIKEVLGEGGMGVVYLAERTDLGSLVAIKVLRDAWLSPSRRERFVAEQRTLAQLNHPSIARLYDAGTLHDGTPFFVMEYVRGVPLTEYCRLHRSSVPERLRLLRAVCEATRFAHEHAVIHRDLKPSNVLVREDGSVRLLDFGIAKHLEEPGAGGETTRTAGQQMTPAYASPEQLRGERTDTQTDVYSLGVILYELLAGEHPHDLSSMTPGQAELLVAARDPERPSLVAARHSASPGEGPPPPGRAAWADLDVLCLTAMHRDRARRYRSVEALIRDLDHHLRSEPLEARPDSLSYRATKFLGRNRRAVAGVSLAVLIVMALTVLFVARLAAERNHANRQSAIAVAINRFLSEDLLGRSDPLQGGKPAETLLDAIKEAASAIDRQFQGEPQVGARLHHTIARALDSRTDYPVARQEYDRAAALYRKVDGDLSEDAILAQLQHAGMEARSYEGGSLPRAKEILAEQEALLARVPHPRGELSVWDQQARGTIAVIGNDAKSAAASFSAALEAASHLPSFDERTRLGMKERLVWSYVRLQEGGKAENLSRELIAELSRLVGPNSANVVRARLKLAQALMVQHRFADAFLETDAAHSAMVVLLGEDHEQTMQALATRAQCAGSMGRWSEAIRDDLELHRLAVHKQGPASFYAVVSQADAALSQCRAGLSGDGEKNARQAYEASAKAFGPRAGLTDGVAVTLATCLIGLGKLDDASRLIDRIDTAVVDQLAGGNDWGAEVALLRGEIAFLRRDDSTAKTLLSFAEPAFTRPDADPYQRHKLESLRSAIDARMRAK
jgi:serine/threonine protein kinase